MDRAAIVDRLLEEPGATLAETHGSWVVITGDRVLKIKKPVKWSFLDYRSLEKRHEACREEVRVNQTLAPEIYLGVRPVLERDGQPVLGELGETGDDAIEFCVEMKRFEEHDTMAARLAAGALEQSDILSVGAAIADFHARAERCNGVPAVAAFRTRIDEDLADLDRARVPGGIEEAAGFAGGLLLRCGEEIESRAQDGLLRDGHGDLRAQHVVLGSPILIVDRIEFDPQLRRVDVADDLSFLLMDLESRGGGWAADALACAYSDAGGRLAGASLAAGFAWRRALVRVKVALLRSDRSRAQALLELASRLAWRSRLPAVVAVCGPPASGKSTLARALGAVAGAEVLSSDVVRKKMVGVEPTERAPRSAYDPAVSDRVYAELARQAGDPTRSQAIVLDATYRHASDRESLQAAIDGAVTWVWCDPPAEELARRAVARERESIRVSDADAAVAADLAARFEPVTGERVIRLTSADGTDAQLQTLASRLDRSWAT